MLGGSWDTLFLLGFLIIASMDGWISLHRKFIEWEWFSDNNMVKLFIYLLLKCNHSASTWKGVSVDRGQLITGLDKLSNDTKISIQTLRTCLSRLEKTQEINMQVTNKYRIITICNYDSYQDSQQATNKHTNKQLTSNQQTTNKQLTANNNDNKKNNDNNENNYKTTLLSELKNSDVDNPKYLEITKAFFELFKKNLIEAGASTNQIDKSKGVWIDHIRLMYEVDKQTSESVTKVFEFLQVDEFWKKNILSTVTLRKQFNKLLLNAKNETNRTKKQQPATSDEQLAEIVANMFAQKG